MRHLRRTPVIIAVVAVVAAAVVAVLLLGGDEGKVETAATTTSTSTTTLPSTTTTTAPPVVPLTGQPLTDPTLLTRPAIAIKIDNVEGKATPQAGINQADLVYEIQVEGQITRFLAIFQSTDAAPVGPVRSARASEILLLEELNRPLFSWHGENGILGPQVRASSLHSRSIEDVPSLFYRDPARPAPYNSMVTGSAELRATAPEGSSGPPTVLSYRAAGESPSPHAAPASHVNIRFPRPFNRGKGEAPVDYLWDGAQWARFQAGHPHVDAAGQQVKVENVIVRFTKALDSGTIDKSGTIVPTAEVTGEGLAWVFTDGKVVVGKWIKPDGPTPTRYVDEDGNDIGLTPGRTWISMPYGLGSSYQ